MKSNGGLTSKAKLFDNQITILRLPEVAEILGYSHSHVYFLVSKNKIPFRKKGKTLFFILEEVLKWVAEGDIV